MTNLLAGFKTYGFILYFFDFIRYYLKNYFIQFFNHFFSQFFILFFYLCMMLIYFILKETKTNLSKFFQILTNYYLFKYFSLYFLYY